MTVRPQWAAVAVADIRYNTLRHPSSPLPLGSMYSHCYSSHYAYVAESSEQQHMQPRSTMSSPRLRPASTLYLQQRVEFRAVVCC